MNPKDSSDTETFKSDEKIVKIQWKIETVKLVPTHHFAKKYLRAWGWSIQDLRDAIGHAYAIERTGKTKYEIYVNKGGYKKNITAYYDTDDELICITGSQGDIHI